ncbi:MAG: hypothetical protein D6800_14515 [Candidatus Zixiibacteriota bacterium]|nr:MAG: hypothetical protein D6800_14515 [candidate division Zixibacteria bacterium]
MGDVGALPPNLDALVSNPGYATWKGPYIRDDFTSGGADSYFKVDAWGQPYQYTGGVTIVSTGSGSSITRQLAASTNALLSNTVSAVVVDLDRTPPGATYADSVQVLLSYPDGVGGTTTAVGIPGQDGYVQFTGIPIGLHRMQVVYLPTGDTMTQLVSVDPGRDAYVDVILPMEVWSALNGGCGVPSPMVLRPNGPGSLTNLTTNGCGANWQCVSEVTPDEDVTRVTRASNKFATDVYAIEDPTDTTCIIDSVEVECRARHEKKKGKVKPTVFINGTEYNAPEQKLSKTYANYRYAWVNNPATGAGWTWNDITSLQAGVRIKGQNANFPAYCTQVTVEVYMH